MDDGSSPVRREIPDVLVYREGGLALFCPLSHRAVTWIEEHIPPDAQWLGTGLVVKRRYALDLAQGMKDAGLLLW